MISSHGQAGGLGVGADRLGALAFVDAERPDLAALLGERVAADPANARAGFVADFSRFLAGDFQVRRRPPAVATKNSVELHLLPPVAWFQHCKAKLRPKEAPRISEVAVISETACRIGYLTVKSSAVAVPGFNADNFVIPL